MEIRRKKSDPLLERLYELNLRKQVTRSVTLSTLLGGKKNSSYTILVILEGNENPDGRTAKTKNCFSFSIFVGKLQ